MVNALFGWRKINQACCAAPTKDTPIFMQFGLKYISMAAALWLAACQPHFQAIAPDKRQSQWSQEAIVASDGARLPLRQWLPEGEPTFVLLAVHGFNDYSHAYALPGAYLQQHGVATYAYDQRGFGGAPQAGIWPQRENLAQDLRSALALLKDRHPHTPVYLMGESMGAAVIIDACADGCVQAAGYILSAPALWGDDFTSRFYRFGAWFAAHTFPAKEWTGEDLEIYASDNLPLLYAMGQDPKVITKTRSDAIYGLIGLMAQARAKVSQLRQPVLLLYGAKDAIVPPLPVALAAHEMTAPLTRAYYPNGYHMLFRDVQRETVFNDVLAWLRSRYTPLPSGADMGWQDELLPVAQ